jgi:hypothetical protein
VQGPLTRQHKLVAILLLLTVMGRPATAVAQATLHVAAGFTGADLRVLKSASYGASVLVGGGLNLGQRITILGEYSHASILSSGASIGVMFIPESSVSISSITLNLKARVPIRENVQLYAIGGYGLYRQRDFALGRERHETDRILAVAWNTN